MKLISPVFLSLLACLSCVDPVVPVYDYATGFVLVEGQIVDRPGYSRVSVRESALEYGTYRLRPIENAAVSSVGDDGTEVAWTPDETGTFLPPATFFARGGVSYHVRVALPGGGLVESAPELTPTPVDLTPLRLRFEQEAYFSSDYDRYVPAFTLLTDVADPAGETNALRYAYRTWSQTSTCFTCQYSIYRNGACITTPGSRNVPRYDYPCDSTCWTISRSTRVELLSDALNPGGTIRDVPAARIDFVGSGGLLAEVEQYSISPAAYAYYGVLRDLTEGSGGLNAPLPAPLYGNLRRVDDESVAVLGFVSVSALSTRRLYWDRDLIDGTPLIAPQAPVREPVDPSPPTAPCAGPNRTTQTPEGWNP